jgi:hypothetical protein
MLTLVLLAALCAVSMGVYLLAVRCASWDLIPAAAQARVRWWHRHAPAVLAVSALVTLAGGCVMAVAP